MSRSQGDRRESPEGRGRGRAQARSLRRGAVLILSLAVLVVLALMATVFSMTASVERNVSRNYIDQVRARFLAESGVHHAIGKLRDYLEQGGNFTGNLKEDLAWVYRGEDFNLNGVLDGTERDVAYPPIFPANGRADTVKVPLEVVPGPSYALEIPSPVTTSIPTFNPRRFSIDGIARVGISGAMDAGTYGSHSDVYTLRVIDASALLYVNDVNPNMPRIINNLCAQIGIPPYGRAIWINRPYGSILEVKKAVPVQAHFDALSPYLSTESWIDDKVVNPVPLSDYEVTRPGSPYADPAFPGPGPKYVRPVAGGQTIYRYGHGMTAFPNNAGRPVSRNSTPLQFCQDSNDPAQRALGGVYGWDELNPQWIETASRAPIDLNKAPREILIAILQDLQGFFAMETPTNIPDYAYDYIHRLQFDPLTANVPAICNTLNCRAGDNGWTRSHVDELASLYTTMKVKGPGASGSGPDAGRIVDAIIARRNDMSLWSPVGSPRRGGPFRSWEDFHRFCDDLVGTNKEIWDNRPMWGNFPTRRLYASRAMADVLKANFNPNLHLNELNPNAPLRMLVDKTDLIMSSTEGTFRPMGVFRIDSLGRVLQPAVPGGDAFTSANNLTVAEAEVTAMVKLYDVHHETVQKDFYAGAFGPTTGGRRTNYGLAVESGPEPHNGPAARENDWEGYIQLASMGGESTQVPSDGVLRPTTPNHASDRDGIPAVVPASTLHSHFMNTFDLDWAKGGGQSRVLTAQLSGNPPSAGFLYNYPDPTEPRSLPTSPYCPMYNPNRYRLARSYRLPPTVPGRTATAPVKIRYAPSDLRVDGAYSERHSALVYNPQNGENWMEGMVSYWIKPSFDVTNAGKPRVFFNLNRTHKSNGAPIRKMFNPTPFLHAFLPHQLYDLSRGTPYPAAQFTYLEGPPGNPFLLDFEYANQTWWGWTAWLWTGNVDRRIRRAVSNPNAQRFLLGGGRETMIGFKPRSFAFGYAYLAPATGIRTNPPSAPTTPFVREFAGEEIAVMTDPLNHAGHPHHGRNSPPLDRYTPDRTMANGGDVMDEGHWTHVVMAWNMKGPATYTGWDSDNIFRRHVQIRVNGQLRQSDPQDMSRWVPIHYAAPPYQRQNEYRTTWDSFPGTLFDWSTNEYGHSNPIRIGSASAVHPGHTVNDPQDGYDCNYPADSTIDEFYMWNRSVDLVNQANLTTVARLLFRRGRYYNGSAPLYTSPTIDLTALQSKRTLPPPITGGVTATAARPVYKLYGLYWTAYTQSIYDYSRSTETVRPTPMNANPPNLATDIGVRFQVRQDPAGPFTGRYEDEQYSKIPSLFQPLRDPTRFQYRFQFTNTDRGNPTLLETPILDDVWFMYGTSQTEILEWSVH